jgi:hypothetical protein
MEVAARRQGNMTLRIPHPRLRAALFVVTGCAVVLGVVARVAHFDGSMVGDELSTLYIVDGHSLRDVLHLVKGDAEISPPLYFILAWLSIHLGSGPDLIRLPALVAGLASIPLAFLLARRLFGLSAGLVAASLMALNPFMVFYSTEGRPYTLAIVFLLGSTLAMLIAADTGRLRWWAAYAALVALAMYAHYTAAFVLGAQLLWLLWARPNARLSALAATGVAAVAYLPWVPGALDDSGSPTVSILSALQGDGIDIKLQAIGNWSFGYPANTTDRLPGQIPLIIGIAALAVLGLAAAVRLASRIREDRQTGHVSERVQAIVLAAAIALATPVAEALLLLAGGTDLFGARNLNTASGGFAVLIAGMVVTAGPAIAYASFVAVLGVFAIGTAKSLDRNYSTFDFRDAAHFINRDATNGDVVVDMVSTQLSPVPTTGISAWLSDAHPLVNIYQPTGPPPFLSAYPPPTPILKRAVREADGHRIFLVAPQGTIRTTPNGLAIRVTGQNIFIHARGRPSTTVKLPGWRVSERRSFGGIGTVFVDVLAAPQARPKP